MVPLRTKCRAGASPKNARILEGNDRYENSPETQVSRAVFVHRFLDGIFYMEDERF